MDYSGTRWTRGPQRVLRRSVPPVCKYKNASYAVGVANKRLFACRRVDVPHLERAVLCACDEAPVVQTSGALRPVGVADQFGNLFIRVHIPQHTATAPRGTEEAERNPWGERDTAAHTRLHTNLAHTQSDTQPNTTSSLTRSLTHYNTTYTHTRARTRRCLLHR